MFSKSKMVDLGGYVIVLAEENGIIKLLGSAAERSDYDEILEINGKSLENATHQEIIEYIHQCIKTKTICLRVKRRTSGKLAISSSLIDAFIIGSRAREHLENIAKDSSITPRDIAQLSREVDDSDKVKSYPESVEEVLHKVEDTISPLKSKKSNKENQQNLNFCKSTSNKSDIKLYELRDDNMELVELNTKNLASARPSLHREVPVDVPDSFVGIIKQTPRYPPPPQPQARTTSTLINNYSNQTKLEVEKLKKYSEEVIKKKAEEEFLRSSLRGSKKLLQLEQQQVKVKPENDLNSAVNVAFENDESFNQIDDLNLVLDRVLQHLNEDVKDVINQANLSKLIAIYNSVMQQKQHHLTSLTPSATELVQEIILLLQEESTISSEAAELLEILTRFELEGLCFAFDRISSCQKDLDTLSQELAKNGTLPSESKLEVEETLSTDLDPSVKVVKIEKSSCEPLGATVRNELDGSVIIGRIVKGGAADISGLLHEGDEILEVNRIEMKGRNVNQVCDLLAEMTGTLKFVIVRRESSKTLSNDLHQHVIHLKALFDYDPDDDLYIPCRELGLCFSKGDILHVIDQTDVNWWQAYREGEHDHSLAGLIPSIHFQLKREAMKQSILQDSTNTATYKYKNRGNKKSSASSFLLNCGKRSHNKRKKNPFSQNLVSGSDEVFTYEEVTLYYPRANIKRPIVLIGPTNIGRHELRQKLMQNTDRFTAAVPHTSRPRREGEINGIDYHFISRQSFEQDIKEGKFVEHGEFEKNYYGTSLGAIEAVVQSGKICVLNLHVHSISILRQGLAGAKLKPYFVFIAPPTQLDRLNKLSSTCSGPHQSDTNNLSTNELQSIIDEARDIETRFGHYFDMILSITDIDRAYQELLREINVLEREPQWIPSIWNK